MQCYKVPLFNFKAYQLLNQRHRTASEKMNNRQRGKNTERSLARRIKAKRVGVLGKEDLDHPLFSVEVKHRKRVVIEQWMQQAERNCQRARQHFLLFISKIRSTLTI